MRTISTTTSLLVTIAMLIGCARHLHENRLIFSLLDGTDISIFYGKEKFAAHSPKAGLRTMLQADDTLADELKKSEEILPFHSGNSTANGSPFLTAIIRIRSAPDSPDGRCGAGHEDYVLLIGIDGNTARLNDQMLIQSCLKDISLVSDKGSSPKDAVFPSSAPYIASFQSSSAPGFEIEDHRIRIVDGKLQITD